jgi:hypothetical protein
MLELWKKKVLKFHSVSKDNFIYYLKELEFKYNFRDNIYDSLYNFLGRLNLGITFFNYYISLTKFPITLANFSI